MPLISLVPMSTEVENELAKRISEIRKLIKGMVCAISGFPPNDVIVNLFRCNVRDSDPDAADFVVFADTCPNEKLEAQANRLCLVIAHVLIDLGLVSTMTAEVWPRFLPGPWCLIKEGEVVDSVEHSRI